jgi:hypothetical protein
MFAVEVNAMSSGDHHREVIGWPFSSEENESLSHDGLSSFPDLGMVCMCSLHKWPES